METSLHKQLKQAFAEDGAETEVRLGRFRIDVVNGERLVEIQHSSLAAIRDKTATLLKKHQVDIVKPIVARKRIVRLDSPEGRPVSERWSPRRRTLFNIFDELLHFTRVFPHTNLRLIVPLVEIVETRYPGHGRRRRWRESDFVVADQNLLSILETSYFQSTDDLNSLLPAALPRVFDTADLARETGLNRGESQRIAYVLRKTGAAIQVGKAGNRLLYELNVSDKRLPKKTSPRKKTSSTLRKKKSA
ncbi:MAG: hypothetical protein R3C03_04850 [Pirellulaceae bacterium]